MATLAISRKPMERFFIGDDVIVTVVRIGPNNVRLAITAPPEVKIVREELVKRDALLPVPSLPPC